MCLDLTDVERMGYMLTRVEAWTLEASDVPRASWFASGT
jgi:hypothetical protein